MSEGGPAEGTAPSAEDVELADVGLVINYLRRVVPVLLEEDDVVHPSLEAALSDKNNVDVLRKFISDAQIKSLLIQRSSSKGKLRGWLGLLDRSNGLDPPCKSHTLPFSWSTRETSYFDRVRKWCTVQ